MNAQQQKHGWSQRVANGLIPLITAIAVSLSALQLWQGLTADLSAPVFRPIHLAWVMVLVFLTRPTVYDRRNERAYLSGRVLDFLLIIAVLWASTLIARFDYDDIGFLLNGLSAVEQLAGVTIVVCLLEATRRTVGAVMTAITVVFIAYAMLGDLLPSGIASKGFSLAEMVRFHVFSLEGVFGIPLGIAAGVVFMFVLFGAFLQVTGAGQFFIDCAFSIAGKYRGGPAKASVIASAALGSISGSAIANTVTTGALTIPMMKKLGYKAEQAAGIEAAASTGGQIMPPVMGAGAFIMAQFTGISYSTILLVSIVPAILYFLSTLLYVHLMACRLDLKGMEKVERLRPLLVQGWHFLLPLILVTILLLLSYSPIWVGEAGCFSVLVAACCRKRSRIGLSHVIKGMHEAAMLALPISLACAAAGIVVGVVGQTGIGLQFTQFLLALSGGHLWLALVLVAVAASVLGMGLPVTAAYIVLSIVAVPALTGFGLSLLTANMILFWLSQVSNVTPPIALAAFAGAGIANASPMKSAVEAFKLAQGLYLIPLMMAFSALIWEPGISAFAFIMSTLMCLALIVAFAGSIEGILFHRLRVWQRIVLLAAAGSLLVSSDLLHVAGLLVIIAVAMLNRSQVKWFAVHKAVN